MSYICGFENLVETYIFGSSFLPVQVYILGFSLSLKFIILDLVYKQEELNEKILN